MNSATNDTIAPAEHAPRRGWVIATAAPGLLGTAAVLACAAAWHSRLPARLANQFNLTTGEVTGTTSLTGFLAVMVPFILVVPVALAVLLSMSRLLMPPSAERVAVVIAAVWSIFLVGITLTILVVNRDITDPGNVHVGTAIQASLMG
ncbi:hypothetical protein KEM60_01249 [Austwickia sp. TVS 96-490-7B]|uniref:hypothetical protein n=1 Tax=Austwickia sp. TVS 96-490-7B TaxID=2830843 RepID=UPI001C55FB2A|nr:hypothetical protein [Austwickia sp. TVS 96-490-7B]MBW3085057.1 hypothetical protein [Austwickia sp. TVS 96-490-7B]